MLFRSSPPRTGASTPSGWNGGSTARGATSTSRIRNRSSGDGSARQHRAELARAGGGLPAGRPGGDPQGHLADLGGAQEGDDGHRDLRHPAWSRDRADGLGPPVRVRDRSGEVLLMSDHRWYAIQTTAGHENKVRSLVERRGKDAPRPGEGEADRPGLLPTPEGGQIKNGKKVTGGR